MAAVKAEAGECLPKKANEKRLNSKKLVLKQLEQGWQEQFFSLQLERAKSRPNPQSGQFIVALAIVISTGLRPDELQSGVTLRSKNNQIEVEIRGSKISKNEFGKQERGIDQRWVVINPDFSAASYFLSRHVKSELDQNPSKNEIFFSYNKTTLRNMFADLSKQFNAKYRPNKKPLPISSYVFRHSMAAHLKASKNLSKREIAMVMGHLSTQSMQAYASAFRSKSKSRVCPIISVRASQSPVVHASKLYKVTGSKQQKPTPIRTKKAPASITPQPSL